MLFHPAFRFLESVDQPDFSDSRSFQPSNGRETRGSYPFVMLPPLPNQGAIALNPPNEWPSEPADFLGGADPVAAN